MTQPQTRLTAKDTDPFDRIYADVTAGMHSFADSKLTAGDHFWLKQLIEAFANERQAWNGSANLNRYRRHWSLFRMRFLRLVAGAYLHISYDLPRAIADNWPGPASGAPPRPSELIAEQIYSRVRVVFPWSFRRASRDWRVVGIMAAFLGPLPISILAHFQFWMLYLREAAWKHARVLATQPGRVEREEAMAEAMCAALEDTSNWRPWDTSVLQPPDVVLFASGWEILLMLAATLIASVPGAVLTGGAVLVGLHIYLRQRRLLMEAELFSDLFGELLADYMDAAIENPEGFAQYRAQRLRSVLESRPERRTEAPGI